MSLLSPEAISKFLNAGYRIVGSHSAVKVCHWTKEALNKRRFCYKKWFGIESHRCVQMTPALQCNFACLHCWRFHGVVPWKEPERWDEPEVIIEGCIKAQRELLSGFGGNSNVPKVIFKEALKPKHFAISLDGEPTFYPMLSELIEKIKKFATAFLVTNGSLPKALAKLSEEPTTLYLSLHAPDEETFKKTCLPLYPNYWKKMQETMEIFNSFKCKKVVRLTLIRNLNFKTPEKYAKLILKAWPDHVEVKSFFHVGEAQQRLPRTAMLAHEEVRNFAKAIAELINYKVADESIDSRVVLLSRS